jgi:mannosyl-3-phosphoglycerate phosphatase
MPIETPVVVFSDIDASIANLSPSQIPRAARALASLGYEGGSVVLCSMCTRAEIEHFQQQLGICEPFIAEGGSAAFIPPGYFGDASIPEARAAGGYDVIQFGLPYADVVAALRGAAARAGVPFTGFNDMTVEEVARDTGLSLLRARLAKLRDYVEPCVIEDPVARPRLLRAIEAARLRWARRGRYDYIGSVPGDEAARRAVRSLYWRAFGSAIATRWPSDPDAGGDVPDVSAWAEGALEMVRALRARRGGTVGHLEERRRGRSPAELAASRKRLEREWHDRHGVA